MNPSIDDRLSSIIRALTDIILPALPAGAGLAREQAQLCLGHLAILRDHTAQADAFGREALADTSELAAALLREAGDNPAATALARYLAKETGDTGPDREQINKAICDLLQSSPNSRLTALVITHEQARTAKDRRWFAAMGFDREFAAGI